MPVTTSHSMAMAWYEYKSLFLWHSPALEIKGVGELLHQAGGSARALLYK